MNRYLEMLKAETRKNPQKSHPPALSKLSKGVLGSFDSRGGRHVSEKNSSELSEKTIPTWCTRSCIHLEELECPDGKALGCNQDTPVWKLTWKRLSSMIGCPRRTLHRGRRKEKNNEGITN